MDSDADDYHNLTETPLSTDTYLLHLTFITFDAPITSVPTY